MLIVGKNLQGLVHRYSVCASDLVDQFSLKLRIDNQVRRMKNDAPQAKINYGRGMSSALLFHDLETVTDHIELQPQAKVLACSDSTYKMPAGYFGLLQTKGTLARLFVSCTCNDGQIEPGYAGKITLELTNHANYFVNLPIGSEVAQIFLFKCSGDADGLYAGKYQGATSPTLSIFP